MNDHNEDWQKALLHHPAIKRNGVDPLWRIIAIIGWLTVGILVAINIKMK
jgi:hypothetical protein